MIFYNRHPTIALTISYHISYNMKSKSNIRYLLPNFINATYLPNLVR